MKLCIKCCENVMKLDKTGQWHNVCRITNTQIHDTSTDWDEVTDPVLVCAAYRGPIGFDEADWSRKFMAAITREMDRALDEGRVSQSEIVRALCK